MWLLFIIIPIILFSVFNIYSQKYKNCFTLCFCFGKKGSGKTTYLVKQAIKHLKRGWNVYTNMDELTFPQVRHIDINELDIEHIPPEHSLLILDEVGTVWDNRHFKNFRDEVRDFFKFQRHAKVKCIVASQTWDIDKKLRDLTDSMILCTKFMNVFSVARPIYRSVVLTESQGDSESRIADNLVFGRFLIFPRFSLTYIPKYAPFFNSFEMPCAPALEYYEDVEETLSPRALKCYKKLFKKVKN